MSDPVQFSPDELFFSTTDSRGVIEKANGVFVRLSGHPWDRLVGAPHNVIRHDDMPGGAFRLMWQTLQAGRPFCAYVVNEAATGQPYEVFATITPLGDGYLSVRSKPSATALRDAAFQLYAPARALERDSRAAGASAAAAAEAGAGRLAEDLSAAGFASYDEFIHAVLPAEVQARAALVGGQPRRQGDGPLFELLDEVHRVDAELSGWHARMDRLADLTTALREGAASLAATMQASAGVAEQVTATGDTSPLMLGVSVWASMMPEIDAALVELSDELAALAASCAETRFRIALGQLHDDAIAQFVVELVDHAGEGEGSGLDAIADLVRALDEGMAVTVAQARHNAELAAASATSLETVRELLGVPQGLLAGWQEQMAGRGDDALARLVPLMTAQLDEGDRASQTLADLAGQCRAEAEPLDASGISDALARIRELAGRVHEEPVAAPRPSRRAAPVDDEDDDVPVAPSRRAAVDDDEPVAAPRRGARFAE